MAMLCGEIRGDLGTVEREVRVSTKPGGKGEADDMIGQAKSMFELAQAEEEQLSLLDPVTPEEMADARERLGPNAGRLAVLRAAREQRGRGRPKGARNKRTEDFARYLLGFGQHPAITMMQIQSTDPEVLIQASEQEKVHSFRKDGTPNVVTERMTYEAAQALRVRCAEGLLPYIESKRPVAVDMTFSNLSDLIIAGETHSEDHVRSIIDAEFTPVDTDGENGE
ncbi:hypothetical protein [Novosphingobium guangzhouense]|uniref:Uncharacterized protein n=1 Tax=Novosphingobium guangzhouense TaxID=1850347 RepID=A0A2K2G4A2_9SPHN|nr:hypothetical protein [Novosphingobium guangzhouense]PNU05818.1 hypothetical protein A8V01_14730 [Novosphingobium guangzhouense]